MEVLLDLAELGELHHNDFEEAMLHEILQVRRPPLIRSTKYGKLNLNELSDKEIVSNFRFKRQHIQRLADALGLPDIITMPNRYSVSSKLLYKMFIFIYKSIF